MINRGNCGFSTKIKNAMTAGASVLIVVTGMQPWQEHGIGIGSHHERGSDAVDQSEGVLTAHIPVFEIDKNYGDLLKQVYQTGEGVYLNANMKSTGKDN